MSIKFGSIVFLLMALFIVKISIESIESAEAQERYMASHPDTN